MSIYIKNMEMPKSCLECDLQNDYGWCPAKREIVDKYSYSICPLIPVPDHGRLGDLDALVKRLESEKAAAKQIDNYDYWYALSVAVDFALAAPTIIPADKEDGE